MNEETTVVENVKPSKREVIFQLNKDIEALNKALETQKAETKKQEGYVEVYRKNAADAEKIVEEMHSLLDTLPGVIGRKKNEDYYSPAYSLSARFCSWLATRIS